MSIISAGDRKKHQTMVYGFGRDVMKQAAKVEAKRIQTREQAIRLVPKFVDGLIKVARARYRKGYDPTAQSYVPPAIYRGLTDINELKLLMQQYKPDSIQVWTDDGPMIDASVGIRIIK